jgi:hypothetical protein
MEDHHEDILQEVLLFLSRQPDRYLVSTEAQFIAIVHSHFYRRLWTINLSVRKGCGTYDFLGHRLIKLGVSLTTHRDHNHYQNAMPNIVNPWVSPQIEALEYLELVTDNRLRNIMTWYYIEGWTLQEVADVVGTTPIAVLNRLRTGVKVIKKALVHISQQ